MNDFSMLDTPLNKYEQQIFDELCKVAPDVTWVHLSTSENYAESNSTRFSFARLNEKNSYTGYLDVDLEPESSTKIRMGVILYFFNPHIRGLLDPHSKVNNIVILGS
jgi:hypothetical protein